MPDNGEKLKERLNKCSKEELVEAFLIILTSRKARALRALEHQADKIIEYLEENSLVDGLNDKDDKTFDRGKLFLKDLPELEARIESLKLNHIPDHSEEEAVKRANNNSVFSFIKQSGEMK